MARKFFDYLIKLTAAPKNQVFMIVIARFKHYHSPHFTPFLQ